MRGHIPALLTLVVVGFLLASGAVHASRSAPQMERTRRALIEDVRRQTRTARDSEDRRRVLAAEVDSSRSRVLAATGAGREISGRLDVLKAATGAEAMRGPGIEVRLNDPEVPADSRPHEGQDVGRVTDRDIQQVVNALWAAGAEALAVNGQRVGAATSIRQAGAAILVNYQPVVPPYRILALGPPDRLSSGFAASDVAATMHTYAQVFGLRFSTARIKEATVSGLLFDLHWAHSVGADRGPSASRPGAP